MTCIIILLVQALLIVFLLYKQHRQAKRLQLMLTYQQLLLAHLQFCNDAHEMVLWKERCDIIQWQKELVSIENYEMAKETQKTIKRIANMINFYRDNLKAHEND